MPLFAFNLGVGTGIFSTYFFFNFALSVDNSLHFGYLVSWILSGRMKEIFSVSKLGVGSEVFSDETKKNV